MNKKALLTVQKKSHNLSLILILILSILGGLISILPVLAGGTKSNFFTFEPDVVYVTNGILYNDTGSIYYIDHPATPAIIALAKSILPLKQFLSLDDPSEFIRWTIINQGTFYLYLRIFNTLILTLSLAIFLYVIHQATYSPLVIIFSWLALFSYKHFPVLGVSIASETISFLILSLLFGTLVAFLKTRRTIYLLLTALVSGLSVANKFTNLAYVFIPPALAFFPFNLPTAVPLVVLVGFLSLLGFLYGIWPILPSYNSIISWALKLATRSGPHGDGSVDLINISTHLESMKTLWQSEPFSIILVLLTLITLLWFAFRTKLKDRYISSLLVFGSVILIFTLAFTKHPISRYQQTNYFAFILIAALLFNRLNKILKSSLVVLVLTASIIGISSYLNHTSLSVNEGLALEEFVINHPSKKATLWEYAYSTDYALLTSQEWYGQKYADQLKEIKPNTYAITADLKQVKTTLSQTTDLFSICWDQLYIQESILSQFLNLYPDRKFETTKLPNTSLRPLVLLESDHCLSANDHVLP